MEQILEQKQSIIGRKFENLHMKICQLFEILDSLEVKLNPVLSSETPQPVEVLKDTESHQSKLISSLLQKEIDRICRLQERIKKINEQLEI